MVAYLVLTRAVTTEMLRRPWALTMVALSALGLPLLLWAMDRLTGADGLVLLMGWPIMVCVLSIAVPFALIGENVAAARESGLLRFLRTAPTPHGVLIAAYVPIAVVVLCGAALFGLIVVRPPLASLPSAMAVVLVIMVLGIALAALAAALIRTASAARSLGIVLPAVVLLGGGALPLESISPTLERVTHYIPTTVLIEALAGQLMGGTTSPWTWLAIGAVLVGAVVMFCCTLRWCRV